MPNADKLRGCSACGGTGWHMGRSDFFGKLPCAFCAGSGDGPRPDTRPAPSVGDDVVEAMAAVFAEQHPELHEIRDRTEFACMQSALTAAAAMGYVLTKQEPS